MKDLLKKNYLLIILIIILILFYIIDIPVLTLKHFQTDNILYSFPISEEDEFTVKWMHSVELTPWEEIFRIDDHHDMILDRTRFKQFGAGVPDQARGEVNYKDGYIVFNDINQTIALIPYGISTFAEHTLIFKDEAIKLYQLVPDGDRINFYTEKINLFEYMYRKLSMN
jgi:hypothetical protein